MRLGSRPTAHSGRHRLTRVRPNRTLWADQETTMIRANSRANYMPPELTNKPVVQVETDPNPATVPVAIECHYCGYEPPAGRKGRICPKCGGSSWEPVMPEETIPDTEDAAILSELSSTRSRFDASE